MATGRRRPEVPCGDDIGPIQPLLDIVRRRRPVAPGQHDVFPLGLVVEPVRETGPVPRLERSDAASQKGGSDTHGLPASESRPHPTRLRVARHLPDGCSGDVRSGVNLRRKCGRARTRRTPWAAPRNRSGHPSGAGDPKQTRHRVATARDSKIQRSISSGHRKWHSRGGCRGVAGVADRTGSRWRLRPQEEKTR